MIMLHPVNHLSTPCTTSMASLLLSFRSSQYGRNTPYICFLYGPTFGGGHDIYISDNAASNRYSYTHCGNTYHLPPGYSSSGSTCRFYAGEGSYKFTPTDVEVFYETTT